MSTKKKLMAFILLLIIIPAVIFVGISEFWGKHQLEKAQLSYLSTIMKAVRGEMQERRLGMQRVCSFLAEGQGFQDAVKRDDSVYLTERLQSLKNTYGYLDYAVVVDSKNQVLAKLSPSSNYNSNSELYGLTNQALTAGKITFSEEDLPLDSVFIPNSREYSKFLVENREARPGEDASLKQLLVSVAIIPIYDKMDSGNIIGAIIICDVLNNDENFPHYVSANMDGSILTLGVQDIRIASNINRNGGEAIIGSKFGTGKILGQTAPGSFWGEIILNGSKYKFLDEPVINANGKKVGIIGVGVQEERFYNITKEKSNVIILTGLICVAIILLIGRSMIKTISQPLEEVTELSNKLKKSNEELELTVMTRTAHLENLIGELQEANAKKARFLANMSHELRTPLNVIIGSSQVLEEGTLGELNPKQKTYAASIQSTGQYLLGLINNLLDLSKLTAGKIKLTAEPIAVAELLNIMVLQISRYKQEKNIQITADCTPMDLRMIGDTQKLRQILLNLMSNSVKFTEPGGSITVQAREEDSVVRFSVLDTGIGIAPEYKKRVFQEFEQIADPYTKKNEGTGLGLAIAKRLVELQGGSIWLESEVGKGTVVNFTLPDDLNRYLKRQEISEG